jgi:hypothetical protein
MTRWHVLRKAITQATLHWPASTIAGDTNLEDYYLLARTVEHFLPVGGIPLGMPPKRQAVQVVKAVGRHLLDSTTCGRQAFIRDIPHYSMTQRAQSLLNFIDGECLLFFDDPGNFLAALYMYHGFLNMAKDTRPTYRAQIAPGVIRDVPYTLNDRLNSYSRLERCAAAERERGNSWVAFGMCLARCADLNHKVVHEWVPDTSPYWW